MRHARCATRRAAARNFSCSSGRSGIFIHNCGKRRAKMWKSGQKSPTVCGSLLNLRWAPLRPGGYGSGEFVHNHTHSQLRASGYPRQCGSTPQALSSQCEIRRHATPSRGATRRSPLGVVSISEALEWCGNRFSGKLLSCNYLSVHERPMARARMKNVCR